MTERELNESFKDKVVIWARHLIVAVNMLIAALFTISVYLFGRVSLTGLAFPVAFFLIGAFIQLAFAARYFLDDPDFTSNLQEYFHSKRERWKRSEEMQKLEPFGIPLKRSMPKTYLIATKKSKVAL